MRKVGRQSPNESDFDENSVDTPHTAPNTESQPEDVPEVRIEHPAKPPTKEPASKSSDESKGARAEGPDEKKSQVLDFKKFDIPELDCIFSDFKTTFDPFVQNRQDLEKSEDSFKKAVQSLGDIHPHARISEYLAALKTRLKDEGIIIKIKEGALTVYKEGEAIVKGISDAVSAINAMLKLGKDLKEMPLTIEKGSTDAVDRAEDLDVKGILKKEFKSFWDFRKIPGLMKAFKNNVDQIKRAPKMVRDFYNKTKEIILEIYRAFADEEDKKKMEEEMAADEGDTKKEKGATGKNESTKEKEKDEFHEKLNFHSVGLADIDNVFTSLASAINPFVETRERLQAARESFENVVKKICNFDGKKELKDYIRELKKDAKEGNITIYIDEVDGEIKVKSIEGVKPPKPYRDAVQALKNIKSSGKEAVELEPHVQHGIENCVDRIKQIDPQRDFHSLLKKKTDVFTLPGKIKKFNDNRKKAQEIPGIVKEFCLYVNGVLKDILEGLTGEEEVDPVKKKGEEDGEKDDDGEKKDADNDKNGGGGDIKGEGSNVREEDKDQSGSDFDENSVDTPHTDPNTESQPEDVPEVRIEHPAKPPTKEPASKSSDESKGARAEGTDEKLNFQSVGLADIDNVFTSLASAINPFVETRERLQAARESFENVVKKICNFDGKKELKDYIRELKKDAKEGNITIYIDEVDGEIKVKSIEGVKPPKPYRDAVQALKNIKSSGKEAVELEPHVQHGIENCVDRIKQIDPQRDFHSLLKKKTDVFTLPGKIKKFNDNRKKAQEIPGIVKEFCLYVNGVLKDILEGLTGEEEVDPVKKKGEKDGEKDDDGGKGDADNDKNGKGGDIKGEGSNDQSAGQNDDAMKTDNDSGGDTKESKS